MAAVGPMDRAYQALAEELQRRLRAGGVLGQTEVLEVDPEAAFEPNGEEGELVTAASLFQVETRQVRALLGAPRPIYVVERECRLELACAGPPSRRRERLETFAIGLASCAAVIAEDPTLDTACERLELLNRLDQDLPPNGTAAILGFVLRVRAGDPIGLTEQPQ